MTSGDNLADFDARGFLKVCSRKPGVYRMFDADGKVLYVGKARDLKARLSSYFRGHQDAPKTRALVARIASIETTVTHNEAEALLLEQALIKDLRPPYNILLRDDKSYPFIQITRRDPFPRVGFHRGRRLRGVQYFGPYPNSGSVRETLLLLEKVFQLRNCRDSFFRNRTRPCLQHQIKRCTAPCVGLVSEADYNEQVAMACAFLEGRDAQITTQLEQAMEQASRDQAYERAAELRDRIVAIRQIQERQYMDTGRGSADVLVLEQANGVTVVEMLMVRQGKVLGNRSWPLQTRMDEAPADALAAFISQFYLPEEGESPPAELITSPALPDAATFEDAVYQARGKRVSVRSRVRGHRQAWLRLARANAENSIAVRLSARESLEQRYLALAELLGDSSPPTRIECFDISHTQGEQAVASCVVFGVEGARKADYRRFNVSPEVGGDDYQALEEAVRRRYQRVIKEQAELPGLLLIDGGRGQVSRVADVLEELGLLDSLHLLGIAKGPTRKPGLEELVWPDGRVQVPGPDNPGLHLLQQIRDEAHRFAITGHRARRAKPRSQSRLEEIPGVGAKRRKALLNYFGGLGQLRNAAAEDIARVPGFSPKLAQTVYDWLHEG